MCIDVLVGTGSLSPGFRDLRRLSLENGEEVVIMRDLHHQVVALASAEGKLEVFSEILPTAIEGCYQPATWVEEKARWTFTNAGNARGSNSMQARILKRGEKRRYKGTPRHEAPKS